MNGLDLTRTLLRHGVAVDGSVATWTPDGWQHHTAGRDPFPCAHNPYNFEYAGHWATGTAWSLYPCRSGAVHPIHTGFAAEYADVDPGTQEETLRQAIAHAELWARQASGGRLAADHQGPVCAQNHRNRPGGPVFTCDVLMRSTPDGEQACPDCDRGLFQLRDLHPNCWWSSRREHLYDPGVYEDPHPWAVYCPACFPTTAKGSAA